jgi:formate dehydrogenase alpha subunit
VAGLATTFGSGAMTNPINEITDDAELLFLIGTNTTEAHPVIGYKMRQAARNGCKLVVCDPRHIDLVDEADYWIRHNPGTDIPLLNGLMHIIIKEGLENKAFIEERTENYEALKATVAKYTPEYVSSLTGVDEELLYEVAKLIATTDKAMLFYTLGITEHVCGTHNVMSCANLQMLTGHLGRPGTGVNPIRGQNNVQGACDMGALPNVYPAYQNVTLPEVQAKFEKAWNVKLPNKVGLKIPEMFEKANEGEVKAMYILGENPVLTDPNSNHIRSGLANLEFLVVQELFLTETAEYADVVLPAASFAECDGTFTNTERRIQRCRKAIEPIPGQANWQTICMMFNKMGYPVNYSHPEEIFNEMASLSPSMAGVTYEKMAAKGIQWPCPTIDHPGTPYLHAGKFTRGLGAFQAIEHQAPGETPDSEYPYLLSTGRILQHYNVTTPYSSGIASIWDREWAEVNPHDAAVLNIRTGDKVKVASRRGELTTSVKVTDRVLPGVIWMSFHYTESPTNAVTSDVLDPITGTGEYKACAVSIVKL